MNHQKRNFVTPQRRMTIFIQFHQHIPPLTISKYKHQRWKQCSISFVVQESWCKMHFTLWNNISKLNWWWIAIYHPFIFWLPRICSMTNLFWIWKQRADHRVTRIYKRLSVAVSVVKGYHISVKISLGEDRRFNDRCCIKKLRDWRDDYHLFRIWSWTSSPSM